MAKQLKSRNEIPEEMTWDLTPLYTSDDEWEKAFETFKTAENDLLKLKGKLADSAVNLATVLRLSDDVDRELSKLYVYVHLKADEDTADTTYMGMLDRIRARSVQISAALSWIEPELFAVSEKKITVFMKEDVMSPYLWAMELILRKKKHILSEGEEKILRLASEPLSTPSKTFGLLHNADMRFPEIGDEDGTQVELTHGNYVKFLENRNREIRKNAFHGMYNTYGKLRNTLASLLDGNIKRHVFNAKVRNFDSALKAALFGDNVDQEVYDNLTSTVHEYLPVFYKYVDLRRKMLNLEQLDMYDLYVPIVPKIKVEVTYEQASQWVTNALRPLGDEYVKIVQQAFTKRWIDVLECRGKRSGAYSSGCYDSFPYILLNYQGTLDHVFTLAHELGHSMHSFLSHQSQPHIYSQYAIFVAEVASTTNESLLHHYLMNTTDDPKLKAYLLNHLCDGFKGTVFRQTMFAEFEKMIHEKIEEGIPLTPDELNKTYFSLNKLYYGDGVHPHQKIELEWARIPHFYYNFYVYKYATGFSAAQAFSKKILAGDPVDVKQYLGFLKAGGSKYPLDILADAGVDLRTPQPIREALDEFDRYVDELSLALENLI